MSTPESTPLAQRLREAARQAVVQSKHRHYDEIGQAVVVAVLRELAAGLPAGGAHNTDSFRAGLALHINFVRRLADSIEKGEADGVA